MSDDMWLFTSYSDEQDFEAVRAVLERGTWWAKGPEVEEFEEKLATIAGTDYAVSFNSGTSALFAAMDALGVSGSEVIVPSFTFPATANAAVAAGAKPVFADIELDSLALDPPDVEKKITDSTSLIVPIHFAGDVCAGIGELRDIANEYDLQLLEDACHSPGATFDGKPAGSFGDAAAFSFCFNKIITTGEGGMVVTDDTALRDQLKLFRSHGCSEDGSYITYGHNFRMSSMTAALGVSQTEKFDFLISERRQMAEHLNGAIDSHPPLQLPRFPPERQSVYQLYNLRFTERGIQEELADVLAEQGIPSRVSYEPVHLTPYYRQEWGYDPGDLPRTEKAARTTLTLPFHLGLDEGDLDRIAAVVNEFFQSR